MASLRCLRVTMCTDQWYFTTCEVVRRDRAPRIEAALESDNRSEKKKQIWCRGPERNCVIDDGAAREDALGARGGRSRQLNSEGDATLVAQHAQIYRAVLLIAL